MATDAPAAAATKDLAGAKREHQSAMQKRYRARADYDVVLRAFLAALDEERNTAEAVAELETDGLRANSYMVAGSHISTIRYNHPIDRADVSFKLLEKIYTNLLGERELDQLRAEATEACGKHRRVAE